ASIAGCYCSHIFVDFSMAYSHRQLWAKRSLLVSFGPVFGGRLDNQRARRGNRGSGLTGSETVPGWAGLRLRRNKITNEQTRSLQNTQFAVVPREARCVSLLASSQLRGY